MKIATFEQILREIQQSNIFPITSVCNIKCEFCSHKNNPDNIDTYKLPKLGPEELEEFIEYLSTDKKIVIGESASRIVEGEPFIHKHFMYILYKIREKYKDTLIQITSNGSFLREDIVKELVKLQPLEINLSLNSSNAQNRSKLIHDTNPHIAISACKLLNQYGIKYNGSLVAMPHLVGYEDIRETIVYLAQNNCQMIRIFIPGVTKNSSIKLDIESVYKEINKIINQIRKNIDTPIVVEPSIINDLDAYIEGTIKGSPAFQSGLKSGDIITKVSNINVLNRVHAYKLAYKEKNPSIEFLREGKFQKVTLEKDFQSSPGFVVLYDIDPQVSKVIKDIIKRQKANKTIIGTSELAKDVLTLLLERELGEIDYKIISIKNNFFGGTIKAAGLLVIEDIVEQIRCAMEEYDADLFIIPGSMLDYKGRDLRGNYIDEIQEQLNIPVEVVY